MRCSLFSCDSNKCMTLVIVISQCLCAIFFVGVCLIQDDQTKINDMVAEYERTHPEEMKMESLKGRMMVNFKFRPPP